MVLEFNETFSGNSSNAPQNCSRSYEVKRKLLIYARFALKFTGNLDELKVFVLESLLDDLEILEILKIIDRWVIEFKNHAEEYTCIDIEEDLKNGYTGLNEESHNFCGELCHYFRDEFKRTIKSHIDEGSKQLMCDIECLIEERCNSYLRVGCVKTEVKAS